MTEKHLTEKEVIAIFIKIGLMLDQDYNFLRTDLVKLANAFVAGYLEKPKVH
jgi:hypothetical protein